jgi:glycosyltransferase involved in cell wall biosynthesis
VRVAVFGTYDTTVHPRGAVLVEGLAEHGFDVAEVNEPLGLGTSARVGMLQQPWRLPLLAARLARCWVRLLVRSGLVRGPDAVLVPYLGHFDVLLARARWPRRTVVLDYLVSGAGTARDRGVVRGPKLWLLDLLDSIATGAADVVVVDTDESAERLPERARDRAVVVPVGATRSWFDAGHRASGGSGAGPLRVVFFGSFTPLQGTITLARALARVAPGTLAVTLLGTGQDHAEVRRLLAGRTDITWHDWVPIDRLPTLVAGHDVCLGIFGDTAKALTVVPTKVYQGAAAGCALLTSDTPPHRRVLGEDALLVPPGDDAALAEALRTLAADRVLVSGLKAAAAARAGGLTPDQVVAPLARVLDVSSRRRGARWTRIAS